MSYILDALKKSERQRRMGEVPHIHTQQEALPPEPGGRNPWVAIALIAVIVNISVGGWLWWQHQQQGQGSPSVTAPAVAPKPTAAPVAVRPAVPVIASVPVAIPVQPAVVRPGIESVPPRLATPLPAAPPRTRYVPPAPSPDLDSVVVFDDKPPPQRRQRRSTPPIENLVALQDLPAGINLAMMAVNINVHVYDDNPAKRFVLIDMKRYAEGHALPQGPIIEHITPDGVILRYKGQRFQLTRNQPGIAELYSANPLSFPSSAWECLWRSSASRVGQ
jgi:general secretion pathway protein B